MYVIADITGKVVVFGLTIIGAHTVYQHIAEKNRDAKAWREAQASATI